MFIRVDSESSRILDSARNLKLRRSGAQLFHFLETVLRKTEYKVAYESARTLGSERLLSSSTQGQATVWCLTRSLYRPARRRCWSTESTLMAC